MFTVELRPEQGTRVLPEAVEYHVQSASVVVVVAAYDRTIAYLPSDEKIDHRRSGKNVFTLCRPISKS